jgi:ComF family protein
MIDSILNFILPMACVICNAQVLERRFSAVCPECWDTLSPVGAPLCLRCGMPAVAIEGPCGRCRTGENIFDFARSAVIFNQPARKIVHHLKYSDRVSLARPIGRILQDLMKRECFVGEVVIPVPLHRSRERERGFNQAELIARNLALPVDPKILRRRKHTPSQTGLSRAERAKNLAAAFELRGSVAGTRVLVVDDVLTTGSTMNEIAKVLKRGKAARVEVLTFARVPDASLL